MPGSRTRPANFTSMCISVARRNQNCQSSITPGGGSTSGGVYWAYGVVKDASIAAV